MSKKNLNVEDLTPEELRASNLPDYCLYSIFVEFTSEADNHYKAVHVCNREQIGPYVLLCNDEKDKKDFKHVEKIVARETGGSPERHITDRTDDICAVIRLDYIPTQSRIVDLVEAYRGHFKDVKIPKAFYHDVPEFAYKNPGLPLEKLTIEIES